MHLLESLPNASSQDVNALGGAIQAADVLLSHDVRYAHIRHMSSHAHIRVGRYADAVEVRTAFTGDWSHRPICQSSL